MGNWKTVIAIAFFLLSGCSDETVDTQYNSGNIVIETSLNTYATMVGSPVVVSCDVGHTEKGILANPKTRVVVNPTNGISILDHRIMPMEPGLFDVACELMQNNPVIDTTPAQLLVTTSGVASIDTQINPHEISTGSSTLVTCTTFDLSGNSLNAETHITVSPEEGVSIDEYGNLTVTMAGEYVVACALTEVPAFQDATPETLTAVATPEQVTLFATPEQQGYAAGDEIELGWIVHDGTGAAMEGISATLEAPATGVTSDGGNHYTFDLEGEPTFVVTLDAPYSHITDSLTLLVDTTAPSIQVTYPTRGATLSGNTSVLVQGKVSDNLTGVSQLLINGVLVTVEPGGIFQFLMNAEHGLNIIQIEAHDTAGNMADTVQGYYYSTEYLSYEAATLEDVKIDDALRIFIGQEVIDDGVHDHNNIDDLATLLEVILADADLETLFNSTLDPIVIPDIIHTLVQVAGMDIAIEGDMIVHLTVTEANFSQEISLGMSPFDGGLAATGVIPEVNGVPGLAMGVGVFIEFPMTFSALFETGFIPLPVTGTLNPTLNTATYFQVSDIEYSTQFLIEKIAGSPLSIESQAFEVAFGTMNLDSFEDTYVDLGNAEFQVFGLGLISIPLGTVDITSLVDNWTNVMDQVLSQVINWVDDNLTNALQPLLAETAAGALKGAIESLEIEENLAIPGLAGGDETPIQIAASLSSVSFTDAGGHIGMDGGTWSEKKVPYTPLGTILRDECANTIPGPLALDETKPMSVAVHVDFFNEALFTVWWAGVFQLTLDEEDLQELAPEMVSFGIKSIQLEALLAPAMNDCNSKTLLRVHLGDALISIDMNLLGVVLQGNMYANIEADIDLQATEDGFQVGINGFSQFHIDIVEINDTWLGMEDGLETTMETLLVSKIEGLLNESIGNFPIPSFDLSGLIDGAPEGAVLEVAPIGAALSHGYLVIEGDLK